LANEVNYAAWEGTYAERELILADRVVTARYSDDNARDFPQTKDIAGWPTTTIRFRKQPVVAASSLTDGVPISGNTAYNPTQVNTQIGEVGLKFAITDIASDHSFGDAMELAEAGGMAIIEKETTDILNLASGLSQTVGTSTSNLTEAQMQEALTTLSVSRALSKGAKVGVLYTQQWWDLVNDIGTTMQAVTGQTPRDVTNDLTAPFNSNGLGGNLFGVDWRVNPLVPTANSGADSAGMIVIKGRTLGEALDGGIRVEFERDASGRATEVVVVKRYSVLEVEDESGVGVVTDR